MTQSAVLVERHGSVAVTLKQPGRRNALSKALCPELARTLANLQDDSELRAVVLHGGAQFCSGGNLSGLDDPPLAMRQAMFEGHRNVRMLTGGRLPVVAAVEGNAFGAGFSLAMACDFVVADEDSAFCAAFGRVGLQPDYGLQSHSGSPLRAVRTSRRPAAAARFGCRRVHDRIGNRRRRRALQLALSRLRRLRRVPATAFEPLRA